MSLQASDSSAMEFVRLRGHEHRLPRPVKMILHGIEAAQDLMVTIRDLRRTVRLVQAGCIAYFPDEAPGLQQAYNILDVDLQQVEMDGQRVTQHLLTALASSYEDIAELASFSTPSTRGVWINHLYLVDTNEGTISDQAGVIPVPMDAFPFRLHIQTLHIVATLGGFIDMLVLRHPVEALIEVAFMLLRVGRPPNLSVWCTVFTSAERTAREVRQNTRLVDVARLMAPLSRFNLLVHDPTVVHRRDPSTILNSPEVVLL